MQFLELTRACPSTEPNKAPVLVRADRIACMTVGAGGGTLILLQGCVDPTLVLESLNEVHHKIRAAEAAPDPTASSAKLWKQAAFALWELLDDVDTASDMAKGNDDWFRRRTSILVSARFAWAAPDDDDDLVWDWSMPKPIIFGKADKNE